MAESTVNLVPLFNPNDFEMRESQVNPVSHFNPNSEDEYLEVIEGYLVPQDNVGMDNHKSGTFRASDTHEPRDKHDDHACHLESIMSAMQQNTAANAGAAAHFRHNPDSPLFKVVIKRLTQEEVEEYGEGVEEYRKQNEKHKNQMHVNVSHSALW